MKKVLLSIVASTLIFNTVFAEELEVLENNEATTIVEETINNEKTTTEVINNESTKETVLTANEDVKTYVAKIGDINYETLDEAIKNASNSDTIELLDNATLIVGNIDKKVTIKGNNFTITVPKQPNTEGGHLAIRSTFNVYNATINFGNQTEGKWSIVMYTGSVFNLYNSECSIKYTGIYAEKNSTINLDNSKFTLTKMNYTTMMSEGRSTINVKSKSEFTIKDCPLTNPNSANGTTGWNVIANNSKVLYDGCTKQGLVKGSLILTNKATANFTNCGIGINLYSNDEIIVNDGTSLTITKCTERAIMSQGKNYSALIVRKGGKLTVTNNGTKWSKNDDERKYYAEKGAITMGIYGCDDRDDEAYIYRAKTVLNFEDGAIVNITNNNERGITFSGDTAYIGNTTVITNNGGVVAVGGGIYNLFGKMTISKDAKIYNNHAYTSSDDIYNSGNKASITFTDTGKDWILDDCDDKIDGWYDDNNKSRWNAHDKDKKYVEEVKSNAYETELTLKAAHGIYGKLIIRYVDTKGNVLSEELTYFEKVDTEYTTIEKEFEDYSLVKVDGETKGKYIDGTITVTYIYEFTSGTGGNDVPETGINTSNALEITTLFSVVTLVTTLILRKRFN